MHMIVYWPQFCLLENKVGEWENNYGEKDNLRQFWKKIVLFFNPKQMPFLTAKSGFTYPDTKRALVLLIKLFFNKQIFLKLGKTNVGYFSLVHAHKPKL